MFSKRVQWVKAPSAKPDTLKFDPWDPYGERERTDFCKLLSDLYTLPPPTKNVLKRELIEDGA